ncbi:MAG: chromate transporter [Betaproteobacteria bacterium]
MTEAPRSVSDLFWTFTRMALQGFGGVLPIAERVLVHGRRWMTPKDFVEALAIAQTLPGPNIVNLSLMVGDRFFGTRGAAAAFAGMMLFPAIIVLILTVIYQFTAELEMTRRILLGMSAVSVGMIAGMGLRLARTQGHFRAGWLVGTAVFLLVAILHKPLGMVLIALGLPAVGLRWWQLRRL